MVIGVPKEIKSNENRVALTPAGAMELTRRGHSVYIETTAGVGSGFDDADYVEAGGKILPTPEAIFEMAEMIMKVKEPIEQEYKLIKSHHFNFHFCSSLLFSVLSPRIPFYLYLNSNTFLCLCLLSHVIRHWK